MGNCVHYLYNDEHIRMDRVRILGGEKNSAVGTCESVETLERKGKKPSLNLTTELKATLFYPDGCAVLDDAREELFSTAVDNRLREDLKRMKKIRLHRGLRVKGQHTKTTLRSVQEEKRISPTVWIG
ncbi:unnamed protein product [Caenorhabditis brenneri]